MFEDIGEICAEKIVQPVSLENVSTHDKMSHGTTGKERRAKNNMNEKTCHRDRNVIY